MNDELREKLRALGLNDEEIGKLEAAGAKDEAGIALLSATEIKEVTGCGLVTAKQIAATFAPAPVTAMPPATPSIDMLPPVPDDAAFLEMLKTGGSSRSNQSM